jgi:hypothetical protein
MDEQQGKALTLFRNNLLLAAKGACDHNIIMNKFIKFLSVLAVLMSGITAAFAQTTQIAVLFHEGEITNYTSGTALIQALDAAVDGDVITLSSGIFQSADITKNVSIRGAGMGYPELGGTTAPTILTGNFEINCPESDTNRLYLEGIVHNERITLTKANAMTVLKCQFSYISPQRIYENEWSDHKYVHCIIDELHWPDRSSLHFTNSAIKTEFDLNSNSSTRSAQFDNCVIHTSYGVGNTSMTNCVAILHLKSGVSRTHINASSSCNHCIIVGCDEYEAANGDNIFYPREQESALFTSEGLFNLTDKMKEFAGTDGGQVGIHGGSLPFTPETTNLKVTKFKVAERTTADGKLPIEISIESY